MYVEDVITNDEYMQPLHTFSRQAALPSHMRTYKKGEGHECRGQNIVCGWTNKLRSTAFVINDANQHSLPQSQISYFTVCQVMAGGMGGGDERGMGGGMGGGDERGMGGGMGGGDERGVGGAYQRTMLSLVVGPFLPAG